ncbi:hypothetical protein [Methylobacterium sp. WL6]|uniref:hypothetical protein n=1 Tax=Methylobacterium sp. WL6 TaxID=2603901 RepID=UPI0011C967C5|nr:hypothetical protein [Methylobacterium sp. WL6]TXN72839.1 hypothetical protein FV230_03435 [Methylobacterium sp. WL6]
MPIKIVHKGSSNKNQTGAESSFLPAKPIGEAATTITVSPPFIDKISIVVKPANDADAENIHKALWTAFLDKADFQLASAQATNGYHAARLINIKSTPARPLIQYRRSEPGKAERIRLEFNPRKLGGEGLTELAAWMDSILPDGWEYVVTNGHVTRIDIAVDVVGVRVENFLCLPKQGITSTVWGVNGQVQTITLGKKGDQTSIYNVKAKRLNKKQGWSGKTKIRVERRLKNPTFYGFSKLSELANPFSGLVMTFALPPPAADMKFWEWRIFGDSVQVRGLAAALALLPKERRAKYRAHLKLYAQSWWNPEALWEGWSKIVGASRLTEFKP